MKRIAQVILLVLLVSTLVCGGCTKPEQTPTPTPSSPQTPEQKEPITLSFVSFVPGSHFEFAAWKPLFIDEVNKRAEGKLIIDYKGGPEIIPGYDLTLTVSQGQIDMTHVPTGFTTGVIPGLDTIRLSEISVQEERQNGTYDYIRELCADANLYFVGRQQPTHGNFFYVFFREPVTSKKDFSGRIIAGSPSFFGATEALDLTPKPVSVPDYYTSLESGVADGIMTALATWDGMSLYEVCPYALDTPFYKNQVCVLNNLDSWNSLPDDMKQLITEVQIEAEAKWADMHDAEVIRIHEKMDQEDAEFFTMSSADTEWFLKTVKEGSWADDEERFPPEIVEKFRNLITK